MELKAKIMKKYIKHIIISLLLGTGLLFIKPVNAQESVSFQLFFDNLNPYGFWTLHPDYGYVWIPDVGNDFVPYFTDGHWVYTNYGWTWISYYDWGWAPFHYGRWDWEDMYGWYWVPGNEWGPSWVVWRRANGYYGWTPMSPGLSISFSVGVYRDRPERWIFVRDRDIVRQDFQRYHVRRSENVTIINNSTVINTTYIDNRRNTTYITGPEIEEVRTVSGRRINPVRVEDNRQPGQSLGADKLEIYRPLVRRSSTGAQKPTPSKVVDIKDIKRRTSEPVSTPAESKTLRRSQEIQNNEPSLNSNQSNRRSGQQIPHKTLEPVQKAPAVPQQQTAPANNAKRREQSSKPIMKPSNNPEQVSPPQQSQPRRRVQPTPQSQAPEPSERKSQEVQPEKPKQQVQPIREKDNPSKNRRQESKPEDEKSPDGSSQPNGRRR